MTTDDPLAEAAALIGEVGRSTQRARRYRALAVTVAEPMFDRALAIGSDVRRAARVGAESAAPAVEAAITELRSLLARCERAIADVRNGATYQEAATAFRAGDATRVAELAPALFTDVVAHVPEQTLYWSVPLASGSRSSEHFLPVEDLAESLRTLATEGLRTTGPSLELGGDEIVRPICLAEQHDDAESPIALAFEPSALRAPVCRLAGSDVVLVYAESLEGPFVVSCSPSPDDEWWSVRPDAYREYVEALRRTLSAQALEVVVES